MLLLEKMEMKVDKHEESGKNKCNALVRAKEDRL